ncbi:hypothetical protein LIER_01342 [Lithospermum erythrorhizon]|uniref:Uncharacterized protein n=1 Tax=Lithospermum erythrorhizon TaxID=34254 RepID=A0AAV3NKI9_LITER
MCRSRLKESSAKPIACYFLPEITVSSFISSLTLSASPAISCHRLTTLAILLKREVAQQYYTYVGLKAGKKCDSRSPSKHVQYGL